MNILLASLLVLHLDFNTVQMKADAVIDALRVAAQAGYNAILWEIENKVKWETCPECVHPEAFTKDEFRAILNEADKLGLEPIPLMQTFGHAEYVLRQPKYVAWRENPTCRACYCVSKPEVKAFQKALVHEYLELFGNRVKRFHLGGDEAVVFGTCPVCSKVNKMDLYVSNLMSVSEELREKGIRPGVWSDMVLIGGDFKNYGGDVPKNVMTKLPRTFTLWNWDYAYGTKGYRPSYATKTAFLCDLGYEVIACPAAQSCSESMFLPRYRYHRDNIAATAELARSRALAGLCLTSWSVHLYPKSLQYPLWEFAARRYRAPSKDAAADFSDVLAHRWPGVPFDLVDALSEWRGGYLRFDARFRGMEKPAIPAAAGELAARLKSVDARKQRATILKEAQDDVPRLEKTLAALRPLVGQGNGAEALVEGGEQTVAFLRRLAVVLGGECPIGGEGAADPIPAACRFYGRTQTPLSAANAAQLAWSVVQQTPSGTDEANLRHVLSRRTAWLAQSEAAKPKLIRRTVQPVGTVRLVADANAFQGVRMDSAAPCAEVFARGLKPGDAFVFDFGEHLVGTLALRLGETAGRVMDAPCRLKLTFAELPGELRPLPAKWKGLCRSWYPDETVNFDFAPARYDLPRRYAFRYVKVEVVACPFGAPTIAEICATAETSANPATLVAWQAPNAELQQIDRVALATLRDCMQTMFEDGPKRDRRLWLGDLRLEALADYQTYRSFDVVKRSLYLLAGTTKDNGLVGTDAYEQPCPKPGACRIYDYTALFPTVVLEYLEASGDRATAEDLWPLCTRQMELVLANVDRAGLVQLVGDWWYFIDHDPTLDRQVPEQGTVIFALKGYLRLAKALGHENETALAAATLTQMTDAARGHLWKPERGVFLGAKEKSPSWLGQAWMALAGVLTKEDAQRSLRAVLADSAAERPRTPYGYHYMTEALYVAGLRDEADRLLLSYWGGMAKKGADTFWECYVPDDDEASPYGNPFLNSACHAWSCGPSYLLHKGK